MMIYFKQQQLRPVVLNVFAERSPIQPCNFVR